MMRILATATKVGRTLILKENSIQADKRWLNTYVATEAGSGKSYNAEWSIDNGKIHLVIVLTDMYKRY